MVICTWPQVNSVVYTSVAPRREEYITTLWNDDYSIIRAKWTLYESYVYAVVQSKAAVREAIEEIGCLEMDDVDDTRREIEKALDKGTCRTGFQFTKITEDETQWHEGTRMPEGKGALPEFDNGARIRLSCEDASADERCQNPLAGSMTAGQCEELLQLNAPN